MIAPHYRKQPPRVGKRPFLDIFDPGAIYANRDLVFSFTGNSAGVTTDTFSVVDYEAIIHRVG